MMGETRRRPTAEQLLEIGDGGPVVYVDEAPFASAVEALMIACRMTTDKHGLRCFTRAELSEATAATLAALQSLMGVRVRRRAEHPVPEQGTST